MLKLNPEIPKPELKQRQWDHADIAANLASELFKQNTEWMKNFDDLIEASIK